MATPSKWATALAWAAVGAAGASAVLLTVRPAGRPVEPPAEKAAGPLRGEVEEAALVRAMEAAVAARDGGSDAVLAALRRVAAADREVEALRLSAAERAALDARFAARKADLQRQLDE